MVSSYQRFRAVGVRLEVQQSRLTELRAQAVADRLAQQRYQELVEEFSALTSLESRSGQVGAVRGEASLQVAELIESLQARMADDSYQNGPIRPLRLHSVSAGQYSSFPPFVSVEFQLNLSGSFFSLPAFLVLLSESSQEGACVVSVGMLSVESTPETQRTGQLKITLPIRAYLRE